MRGGQAAIGVFVAAFAGCHHSTVIDGDAGVCSTPPCEKVVLRIPIVSPGKVDILFVVDTSPGMATVQSKMTTSLHEFFSALASFPTRPDFHVAVISGDVGAGPYNIPHCDGFGDDGRLQYAPRLPGCTPPNGAFLQDDAKPDGTRDTNFTGPAEDAFGCIAQLGTDGCPYQQPLEAMRRALTGDALASGFLRAGAYLGVVFITNSDDCSATETAVFDPNNAALGPASTFRCFQYGAQCVPDTPQAMGTKLGCGARDPSMYLATPQSYADAVSSLAPDEDLRTVFALLAGDRSPVVVGQNAALEPEVQPSCAGSGVSAAPPIRLGSFIDAHGQNRGRTYSACQADYDAPFTDIAQLLFNTVFNGCLPPDIASPVQCRVDEVYVSAIDDATFVDELPVCDDAADPNLSSNLPCFAVNQYLPDAVCATGLYVQFYPLTRIAPTTTYAVVRCLVNDTP